MEKKIFKTAVSGRELILEFSYLAGQTNGSVLVRYGDTVVLVTAVMSDRDSESDYLPLRVDYEEKFYAVGKILGSRFLRRESRASDEAILSGRIVDRTIRPLFDQRIRRDIQVVATVLVYDNENDCDFAALLGASAALATSDIPWMGPVAGVRVAKIGACYVVNPKRQELEDPELAFEAFVAGLKDKINMIEFEGKEAKENEAMEAFKLSQKEINKLIDFQNKVIAEIGKEKAKVILAEPETKLKDFVQKFLAEKIEDAVYAARKADHKNKLENLKKELFEKIGENFEEFDERAADNLFEEEVNDIVHKNVILKNKRPDGRSLDQVRGLSAEVGLLNRAHGSALFNRGETQSLAVLTLAAPGSEQIIETMRTDIKERFLLHYDFPPYSVHEIGSFRGPGRREIGHGTLAKKALKRLLPSFDKFPYVIRLVSEILSSNGSSSMASVCAGSLALMDGGVPIEKPAAGIAMGLMTDGKNYKILTDIQGPEDHHGDMDFKAAGTESGVTAIQLDVKFEGLDLEIIEKTLSQAKKARLEILNFMKSIIAKPRNQISSFAPVIISLKVEPEKIGEIIGSGGKIINGIIAKTGVLGIDIEEDGRVYISAAEKEKADLALKEIEAIIREFKVGDFVEGNIIKLLEFGAIVDLGGGKDGMIHISEFKNGFVKNIEDVAKVGDFVRAKVIRAEPDGKIALSLKQV